MGSYANMKKMKDKLDFSSKVNLEDGLLKFKKWAEGAQ